MDKTMALQMQIRQNAEEMSSALHDIGSWEKKIKVKDTAIKRGDPVVSRKIRVVTREGGTVKLSNSTSVQPVKGQLTPASLVGAAFSDSGSLPQSVPVARGHFEQRDFEEIERERGNAEFKAGNFTAAVKCYTKCLGLKSNNYIAFSNRAMAYLKLKEYHRVVSDCDCALRIEPDHVKSLMRRATAYNALGKHRAALSDLLHAQQNDQANKQVRVDLQQTKELLRQAVNRAPFTTIKAFAELVSSNFEDDTTPSLIPSAAIQQGPDPRPQDYHHPSSSSSTSEILNPDSTISKEIASDIHAKVAMKDVEDGMHRISIMQDDNDDENDEQLMVKSSSKTKSTIKKTKSKSGMTGKKSLIGAYELEKALIQAQNDLVSLHNILDKLSAKDCGKIFSSAIEPDVLYLLLNGFLVIAKSQATKENTDKAWQWFDAVRQLSGFGLLYSLMSQEQKDKLTQGIITLPAWEDGGRERIEHIRNAFSL